MIFTEEIIFDKSELYIFIDQTLNNGLMPITCQMKCIYTIWMIMVTVTQCKQHNKREQQ